MRECGMLLPVDSLPSRYGIGAFSKEAYDFIDTLKAAGQSFWQILPLGPTGFGDSPYQAFSAFAGNPYFIDLEKLAEEGKGWCFISLYYGEDVTEDAAQAAGARFQAVCPDAEISVLSGGQPVYYYIISFE